MVVQNRTYIMLLQVGGVEGSERVGAKWLKQVQAIGSVFHF